MLLTCRVTFFLLLMCVALPLHAQEHGVFDLDTDSATTLPDKYVWLLKEAPKDLAEALPGVDAFNRKLFRPEKGRNYWFTYAIRNAKGKRTEIGLDAWSDVADFYVIRSNGKIDSCTTGILTAWSRKKEFRNANVCVINLDTLETVSIVYKAQFKTRIYDTSFKIAVLPPDRLARKDLLRLEKRYLRDEATIYNFYAGLFAMASLVYFFFYSIVRERTFLYFGIFVALLAVSSSRLLFIYFLERPQLAGLMNVTAPLCACAFVLFYREYFETRLHVPFWDKFILSVAILYIGVNIHFAITNRFLFFNAQNLVLMVSLIVVMALIPFRLPNKDRQYKYFLLYASLPLILLVPILAAIYIFARVSGAVSANSWYGTIFTNANYIQLLALAWMVLFFSRTLIRRFTMQREQILRHEAEKQNILLHQEQEKRLLMEKLNTELEEKVMQRTAELKASLEELKATQSQLIQSEKMASLGEMTAGIAHEIQNPLNFVNNFAELNKEIAEELKDAFQKKMPDEEINAIIEDMVSNSDKIQTHGKRAESIVRNMLQHSRNGEGIKEPMDINPLVEEFVKLSFHGFRARDKSFNADFRINTDPELGKAMVVGQNFGRVILNLVNNAFYAVHTRNKKGEPGYSPMVTASTQRAGNMIRIVIEDNGDGIPEKIRQKIFQPFFTTKPTGEGTGLGLSISYDIITIGHQGVMKVESKEGEGTRFIIEIPA